MGRKEGIFTYARDEKVSITGERLARISTLCERVLGISSLNQVLSDEYVERLVIGWALDDPGSRPAFSEFLMRRVNEDVGQHEVWIPVSEMQVEEPFQFGSSQIVPMSPVFFDEAEKRAREVLGQETPAMTARFRKLRTDYQNNAAIAVTIEGEKS